MNRPRGRLLTVTARAHASSGAYPADRAAALAGIPKSTLHYWARTELVVPSISSSKLKRWSYADLLLLRLIDWLRQDKPPDLKIAKTSIRRIRQTLARAEDLGEHLMSEGFEVYVDQGGGLVFGGKLGLHIPLGHGIAQGRLDTKVDLVRPFEAHGLHGPDLVQPRASLRIVPGKLSGEPHVEQTRIPTQMLAALSRRGFGPARIVDLYPALRIESVEEALDLERQLERNLQAVA